MDQTLHIEKSREIIKEFFNKLPNNKIDDLRIQDISINMYYPIEDVLCLSIIERQKISQEKEIEVNITKDSQKGVKYIFIKKSTLEDKFFNVEKFALNECSRYLAEKDLTNAYSLNLERVKILIDKNLHAISIVFLVSAFENIMKELFLLNSDLWSFRLTDDLLDNKLRQLGSEYDPKYGYSLVKEIKGQKFGLNLEKSEKYQKWEKIYLWDKIFHITRRLGIYQKYFDKLVGNQFEEIANFEILRDILENEVYSSTKINFQRLYKTGGVVWLYRNFFNIDLLSIMKEEIEIINETIKNRHRIIHGHLKDSEIKLEEIELTISSIKKIISFLNNEFDRTKRKGLFRFLNF